MTAWEQLISGSTLTSGTAWEHLNAQGGTQTLFVDSMSATIAESVLSGVVLSQELGCSIANANTSATIQSILIAASIDDEQIDVGNVEIILTGECVSVTLDGEIVEEVL